MRVTDVATQRPTLRGALNDSRLSALQTPPSIDLSHMPTRNRCAISAIVSMVRCVLVDDGKVPRKPDRTLAIGSLPSVKLIGWDNRAHCRRSDAV
ncbi:MAG TPA: hypothetical protein VFQ27_01180 [Xanthobacteraceae bacterium]|nr:hypothetical protein [Xanthobacteraceae bacterium]